VKLDRKQNRKGEALEPEVRYSRGLQGDSGSDSGLDSGPDSNSDSGSGSGSGSVVARGSPRLRAPSVSGSC